MVDWFAPMLHMHWLFVLFATLSSIGLAVAALIPETVGWKVTVHRISAFTMAYFMFPIVVMIGLSSHVSTPARAFAGLSVAIMLAEILLLNHHKRYHPKMLLIQASYVAVFHATILAATYTH